MATKNKKVLVTGGAGYVGSMLIPLLLEKGYYVRTIDNLTHRYNSLLTNFINPRFEFLKGDIRDRSATRAALKGMDFIVHLAAVVGDPASRKDPDFCWALNFAATKQLNGLRQPNQKLIFASTGSVYGHVPSGLCTERTPTAPQYAYGQSKLAAEKEIMKKPNYIIYRFATAFGLSHRPRLDLMINDFVYQTLFNKFMLVYEKDFRRTFIHVRDMARAFLHGIENFNRMKNQIYNVGNEKLNYTKEDICLMIKNKIDYFLKFTSEGRDPDQRNYQVDYSKISKKGFKTIYSVEDGIDELIRAYRAWTEHNPFHNAK